MFIDPQPGVLSVFQQFSWNTAVQEAASWRSSLTSIPGVALHINTNHWFIQNLQPAQQYLFDFIQSVPGLVQADLSIITPGFHYEQPATQDSGTWCHVPLLVPQDLTNLWITSGGEQRTWQVGALLCIPKSAEYIAHNGSSGSRVILRLELAP